VILTIYEPVIGLEIHAELETHSKMFCGCAVVDSTTAEANTVVCPVCLGMPGMLPVINRQAVEMAIKVGLALHCRIEPVNQFARKSYFYPDLPKGYQISQYGLPLARDGWVEIDLPDGSAKRIRIRRAHLEEDTGKSTHVGAASLMDFNRSGVPLLEIVSEPDIQSPEEAEAYARKLRAILQYLGVNNGDMSKGILRLEANISVRPAGSDELRTRTEVKNLNSIRSLSRASAYEIVRHGKLYDEGKTIKQATMGWDETRQVTVIQRIKENEDDYRYFPEPDLPILEISPAWVEAIRATLPELPDAKRDRLISLSLSRYEATVLVSERAISAFFDATVAAGAEPKKVSNWIINEVFRLMNRAEMDREQINEIKITPEALASLIRLVDNQTISNNAAKNVLDVLFTEGGDPAAIVEARGLALVSDEGPIREKVNAVLDSSPKEVARYAAGEEKVAKLLMGTVMREVGRSANPQVVQKVLIEALEARKHS
jgi:aspartyl-tRNA(Asn)/glutamyl-tRNA(Gln) amidotransferase subunit B